MNHVAFVSKALSDTEQCWVNIECEAYALVFGCERFWTYVYGGHFTIKSDHKPLEQIIHKTWLIAPARLQWIMMHLQPYDFDLKYRPGKEMILADVLSRYHPHLGPVIPLDITIHHTQLTTQCKSAFQKLLQLTQSWMLCHRWSLMDGQNIPLKCPRTYRSTSHMPQLWQLKMDLSLKGKHSSFQIPNEKKSLGSSMMDTKESARLILRLRMLSTGQGWPRI